MSCIYCVYIIRVFGILPFDLFYRNFWGHNNIIVVLVSYCQRLFGGQPVIVKILIAFIRVALNALQITSYRCIIYIII